MKRPVVIAGVVIAAAVVGLFVWAPGNVIVECSVGGPLAGGNRCTFLNNSYLPARHCVGVRVENFSKWTESADVCSGLLMPQSTTTVAVIGFPTQPSEFCSARERCDLTVKPR